MIYEIRHVTTYSYATPVNFARCALRLHPAELAQQHVISHRVDVEPHPESRSIRRDFFGTPTESLLIEKTHRVLRIVSHARVEVSRRDWPRDSESPSWEVVRDEAMLVRDISAASPVNYVFASPMVPILAQATAYAAPSFTGNREVFAGAVDLMSRIRREFKYVPGATDIATPLHEVLENRHGVCQDFAHVMIAGLRGLGLPAAYVSGYLRTIPPPGQPRLQGADASHAWVAVWCGSVLGWIGFDPTNDLLVVNDHIVLSFGRDFADVSPIDGIIVGAREQKLAVAVDVLLVE